MTIHIHRAITTVSSGDHEHSVYENDQDTGEGRTWTIDCRHPGCEERILKDVEFSGHHPGSVPATVEERAEEQAIGQAAQKDVSRLAMALSQLAKQDALNAG